MHGFPPRGIQVVAMARTTNRPGRPRLRRLAWIGAGCVFLALVSEWALDRFNVERLSRTAR